MKKNKTFLLGLLSMLAIHVAATEANSVCTFWMHQSELPESVKALRKF